METQELKDSWKDAHEDQIREHLDYLNDKTYAIAEDLKDSLQTQCNSKIMEIEDSWKQKLNSALYEQEEDLTKEHDEAMETFGS